MKAFVIGGTGFVGREVLHQLHAAGHSLRVLARKPDSSGGQWVKTRFGAEIHGGDLLNPASLEGCLTGIDAVVHLVGIISEIGDNTFENVHTRGTQNVVTACQESGVNRLLHMSALGTRPNARSRYHQSKWAAEGLVRTSGLAYTIFRPSIIYGPDDMFVNTFVRMSRFSPVLPVIGSGLTQFQPVAVEAVASCFVGALSEPKAIGQTYDLCGAARLTLVEIIDQILDATRRKRMKVHLPVFLVWRLAAFLEFIFSRVLRRAPPLNRDQLIMLQEDNVGDPKPANGLFGLESIRFREGIAKYLK